MRDTLLAGAGTFVALAAVGGLAAATGQPLLLGSFGASCVLLFGFPAGPFSQPRNVLGGHLLTTTVALLFITAFGPGWLSMAAAAAAAVMLMIVTRTVHPPAGSNPVIVFVGHGGWSFLLMPTALGAAMLVALACVFWRLRAPEMRWPQRWW
ncbi:HPP family protein [Paucibacter sp. R3-3]|uniref:HPP family protein n=1 Tax=Roseateles agri TaxID=3098619 RepID=A0ABU5DEC9_9BURK|nr:HPP family protein [Paucibacter sp. R3-3]MDY0744632.1 HPP family protein [Paucibacter sp. R3-3]